jgi:hypothetical protein
MKELFLFFFLLFSSSIIQNIDLNENGNNLNISDNNSIINSTYQNKTKKKRKKKKKIHYEQPQFIPETSGVHINDTVFDQKLKQIIEEKNLKPNKKITKQQLKTIFVLIYKKEDNPNEKRRRRFDEESELTPEEQSEQFMDTLFNKVAKGLDWDDKIKVKDIKEWIPPVKTREAYDEMLYSLAEEMGYL